MKSFLKAVADLVAALKGMSVRVAVGTKAAAQLIARATLPYGFKFKNVYRFECRDSFGNLKWVEEVPNQVTTVGATDVLDKYFKGSSYTAGFFVGLVDASGFTAYAAGNTMASHSGWTESVAYSNATRLALTLGTASAGAVDNSASQATFNINATATIKGAFVTTVSTKSGTTGTLFGAASFGADRTVASGDTLNVTISLSAS